MPSYVFPGSTPYIEAAAESLGLAVSTSVVQKIQAIKTISVLCSQLGAHPDPAVLLAEAAEFVAELKVALKAAESMIALIGDDLAEPDPGEVRKRDKDAPKPKDGGGLKK